MRRGWSVVLCVVALVACQGGSGGSEARRSTSSSSRATVISGLRWHACAEGECARFRVPLDWSEPDGRTIALALAREPARDRSRRIGSLFVNPGGPGASGVDIVQYIAAQLPRRITDRFDIVGWDPRGTGRSAPVDCGKRLDYLFVPDTAPDDPAELGALEAAAQRFVAACRKRSGDLLAHISTEDTVRDLDALRAAVGDRRLNYLGLSYGTYIGAMFAARSPNRIRAMVLDGAVDPSRTAAELSLEQSRGFDASLAAFFTWCQGGRSRCRFAAGGDPSTAYRAIQASLEQFPLRTGSGPAFGPTQLDVAVAALLYGGDLGYRMLADGLRELQEGTTATLRDAYDSYLERNPDGTYEPGWSAFLAISCADGPNLDLASAEALQRRAALEAPYFGASNVGLGYACSYWPDPPDRTGPIRFEAPSAPPILVIGTTGDPATPLAWAEGLAEQLGSGRLLVVDGSSHTSSLEGIECVDRIVAGAVVDRDVPPTGTRCP